MHAHIHGHDRHNAFFVYLYSSPPVILYLSLAVAVLHYSFSFLVAAVAVELSPGPESVVISPIAVASASPAPEEVDGVLNKLLYNLLVCFCHVFSVFVVHSRTHTQINLSPSLPAIALVTCAQCTHMLATLLITLGRLSATRTVINTGNHSPTLAEAHCSPLIAHMSISLLTAYTCNCIKLHQNLMALCVCFST